MKKIKLQKEGSLEISRLLGEGENTHDICDADSLLFCFVTIFADV